MSLDLILEVTRHTVFKQSTKQSSELPPEDKTTVVAGTKLNVHSFVYVDADHIRVAFDDAKLGGRQLNTWIVFEPHIQLKTLAGVIVTDPNPDPETAPNLQATDEPDPVVAFSPSPLPVAMITLPGRGQVNRFAPILGSGGKFTWNEATHDGSRIPRVVTDVDNIMRMAELLQRARDAVGRPFHVTSWYRPEPWNSRVGGARRSQHLTGKGADVKAKDENGNWMTGVAIGRQIRDWWPGGLGIYPGNRRFILHLDTRTTGRARWGGI